ncbi:hypothetical protein MMC08_003425 [Hypocenomyce scalaris]|nr:hypothetical protein [Hypocenomyce scalaris]
MQNQQNNGFSDIFQVKGNENSSYVNPFSGSCFSPPTVIPTASGDRPIHSLGANDKILTRAAQEFGILSDEKVQQDITPVGFRNKRAFVNLCGFNGEESFVTAGHIFFTLAGPKAIQPGVARLENSRIHVRKLIEGDITYDVTSKVLLSQQSILAINVTDPKNTGTLIKSLLVRFTTGSDDASPQARTTLLCGRTDFTIAGGKTAAVSDNSVMAKFYSSNTDGFAMGSIGLSITITGSVNAQAGTAVVKVSEGAASRPDKAAATDVYQYLNISKA